MLAAAPEPVAYLWEPFSPRSRRGVFDAPIRWWFTYVCDENAEEFAPAVRDLLAFRYHVRAEFRTIRSPRDAGRMARDLGRFRRFRRTAARPLLKDPIAVFSTEWLAARFGMEPIVLIRHPAAFTASLKRLGWTHPFDDFLQQPLLMRDLLGPFEVDIRRFAEGQHDVVDQGVLLWNVIHLAIDAYRNRHPGWRFVRHEDLSTNPLPTFRSLYDHCGLTWTRDVEERVRLHSNASNPAIATSVSSIRRNSAASIRMWRSVLTPAESERVRIGTAELWPRFYGDQDWAEQDA